MDELLTTAEILAELKISRSRLYHLLNAGEIQAYRIGNGSALRFKRADVQALLKQRQAASTPQRTLPAMKFG
jgi:excisionase family DNA binding protein